VEGQCNLVSGSDTILDFYRIPIGYGTPGTFLGTFQLDSSGNLIFTAAVSVNASAVTSAAGQVDYQGAVLNGSVTNSGSAYFLYTSATDTAFANGVVVGSQTISGSNGAFSATLTGLSSTSGYLFCAVAVSGSGTPVYGGTMSFTTNAAPAPISNAAAQLDFQGAVLSGTVNPGNATLAVYFQTGTDSAFSSPLIISGSGTYSGTSDVPISGTLSQLNPGTQYYYRAVASNGATFFYSATSSFVTLPAPVATTVTANALDYQDEAVGGSVNPSGATMIAGLQYTSGADTTYSNARITGTQSVSGTTDNPVSATISGLTASTQYRVRTLAFGSGTTVYGADIAFTSDAIPATPPTAITGGTNFVSYNAAVVSGMVNPNGARTQVHFEYGSVTSGTFDRQTAVWDEGLGGSLVSQSGTLAGLSPATAYQYRLVAASDNGTVATGSSMTFTTALMPSPAVTTIAPPPRIEYTSAVVSGSVYAYDPATTVYFVYWTGTTTSQTSSQTLSGTLGTLLISATIPALSPETTYSYRLVASASGTAVSGGDQSFKTLGGAVTVGGVTVSSIGDGIATVSATVMPNGFATGVWFEYGRIGSYTMSTADGTIAAGGSTSLVSGTLTGLDPHATYQVRCTGSSTQGVSPGASASFRTLPRMDINGDGVADLLVTGTKGSSRSSKALYVSPKNGRQLGSAVTGPAIPSGYAFCGSGDFDGDGKTDWVFFETAKHRVWIWRMNGVHPLSKVLGPPISSKYNLVAVADMTGDGKPDLILVAKSGRQTAVLPMNGMQASGALIYGPLLPRGYSIAAVEDMNGDGVPDYIVWDSVNNLTDTVVLNSSLTASPGVSPGPKIPTGWSLASVGGYLAGTDAPVWLLYNSKTRATQFRKVAGRSLGASAAGPSVPSGYMLLPTK